jgi:cation transport regulator ChaC
MADHFLCFAYGSNMLTRRLRAPERAPSAQREGIGYVQGYRLTFDKGSTGKKYRSGKCDMERTGVATDRVWGVLFSIPNTEEAALDKAEGLDKGYRKDRKIPVVTDACTREGVAYIATEKDPAVKPYHWYKAFVVAGAVEHGLPPAYVEWLRTFESQPDPDAKRRAENEALLFQGEPGPPGNVA